MLSTPIKLPFHVLKTRSKGRSFDKAPSAPWGVLLPEENKEQMKTREAFVQHKQGFIVGEKSNSRVQGIQAIPGAAGDAELVLWEQGPAQEQDTARGWRAQGIPEGIEGSGHTWGCWAHTAATARGSCPVSPWPGLGSRAATASGGWH